MPQQRPRTRHKGGWGSAGQGNHDPSRRKAVSSMVQWDGTLNAGLRGPKRGEAYIKG